MRIYTRTGDEGTTGLLGGARVSKDDPRIHAFGAVDEFNAMLGLGRAALLPSDIDDVVARMQHDLFELGAELASPGGAPRGESAINDGAVLRLEQAIDHFEGRLPALREFILPGGTPAAAALHVARTVCRRAEREMTALSHASPVRPAALKYVNRAGDLLFVLARAANAAAGAPDVPWSRP